MNQSIKTLLITIGLVIGVTLAFYAILYPFSPRSVKADIYTLRFLGDGWENRYQIQGNQMTCRQEKDYPSTTCTTTFEGKPFTIDVTYNDDTRHLASLCRVEYDGQGVVCEPTINYENYAPTLIVKDSLGVSLERFQELRAKTPLLYLSENQWLNFAKGLAALLALAVIVWRWWQYPKLQNEPVAKGSRFLLSTLVGFFTWFALAWGLGFALSTLLGDNTGELWRFTPAFATLGGFAAFVWEWKMLGGWKPETAVFRFIYSFGGGLVLYATLNFLLLGALLMLGFVD
jgi:hypothetical protein